MLAFLVLVLLAGCGTRQPPVVIERSLTGPDASSYVVQSGDTLYSIALRFEKDYEELARLNGLDSRYTIRPGQRLRLRGTAPRTVLRKAAAAPSPARKPGGPAVGPSPATAQSPVTKKPSSPTADTKPEVRESSPPSGQLVWSWPAKGPVIGRFGGSGVTGKGLDIAGRRGDSVMAAAPGVVVYAGSALVGYGRLLIIRHDDNYISAYAHNDRFLVKEGDRVRPGQVIAEMGASGADREKLHFEIRERGKPVDPLRFLPARE